VLAQHLTPDVRKNDWRLVLSRDDLASDGPTLMRWKIISGIEGKK
jgi:hypothetical protein